MDLNHFIITVENIIKWSESGITSQNNKMDKNGSKIKFECKQLWCIFFKSQMLTLFILGHFIKEIIFIWLKTNNIIGIIGKLKNSYDIIMNVIKYLIKIY